MKFERRPLSQSFMITLSGGAQWPVPTVPAAVENGELGEQETDVKTDKLLEFEISKVVVAKVNRIFALSPIEIW